MFNVLNWDFNFLKKHCNCFSFSMVLLFQGGPLVLRWCFFGIPGCFTGILGCSLDLPLFWGVPLFRQCFECRFSLFQHSWFYSMQIISGVSQPLRDIRHYHCEMMKNWTIYCLVRNGNTVLWYFSIPFKHGIMKYLNFIMRYLSLMKSYVKS